MLKQIMPELPVNDVPAAVAHYREVFGFGVNYAQDDIGVMDRDTCRILLVARTGLHTGIGSAYIYVDDADALFAEFQSAGALLLARPVDHPWGLRDFVAVDPDGNRITFGQPLW